MKIFPASMLAIIFTGTLLLAGCSSIPRTPVTPEQIEAVQMPGFPDVRYWIDTPTDALDRMVRQRVADERKLPGKELNWLMISGGGENGAFGAGALNGLSEAGKRPEFLLVSGVSTGALSAPFAFLGSKYDQDLKAVYTTVNMEKLLIKQYLSGLLGGGDALLNPRPLKRLIAGYITPAFLAEIAREHNKGRRLYIVTTNLDTQRPVLWDMGQIAQIGGADAATLFADVMLASASIPGMFPPVMMDSVSNGKRVTEMHVDGGTTMQILTMPVGLELERDLRAASGRKRNVYILMNNRIEPDFTLVERNAMTIAARAMATLIKNHGIGSVRLFHELTKDSDMGFHVAYIGRDFIGTAKEPFEQAYMQRLYEYGRQQALAGNTWKDRLPAESDIGTAE